MTYQLDGLVAPEGQYTPSTAYVLPPAPPLMVPLSQTQMQSATVKDASSSAPSSSTAATSNSHSHTGGSLPIATHAKPTSDGNDTKVANQEVANSHTILNHISLAAPSAWSHAPIQPPSRVSVVSIKYPAQPGPKKERREASTVVEQPAGGSAGSDTSAREDSNLPFSDLAVAAGWGAGTGSRGPPFGPLLESSLSSQGIDGSPALVTGGQGGVPGVSALQLLAHLNGTSHGPSLARSQSLASNMLLSPPTTTPAKNLMKPKNNIKQSSSSFVQRLQTHSDLTKLLGQRADGQTIERFAFVSRTRVLYWLGESAHGWIKDPLSRLTFASSITSHDINQHTRSPSRLDVIVSFTTADLIWFEPFSARYSRFNKGGCVNDSQISHVRWIPGSETLFLTTHMDGTCCIFDVGRDDAASGTWTPVAGVTIEKMESAANGSSVTEKTGSAPQDGLEQLQNEGKDGISAAEARMRPWTGKRQGTAESVPTVGSSTPRTHISEAAGQADVVGVMKGYQKPVVKGWDPKSKMLVTRPGNPEVNNESSVKKIWSKLNPVAHWRITKNASITDVAFAPDHTRLAIVSSDGDLSIVDLLNERLDRTMSSYYGGFTSVVWAPDARLLLTGGCDDLVCVWSPEGRELARCIGHSSFVTGLAFDPWRWRPEDRTYRFGSVGEDGKVILWDFSSAALHRPKFAHTSFSRLRRGSQTSQHAWQQQQQQQQQDVAAKRASMSLSLNRARSSMSGNDVRLFEPFKMDLDGDETKAEGEKEEEQMGASFHHALTRKEVAELQPVAVWQVGGQPIGASNLDEGASGGGSGGATSTSTGGAHSGGGVNAVGYASGQAQGLSTSGTNTAGGNQSGSSNASASNPNSTGASAGTGTGGSTTVTATGGTAAGGTAAAAAAAATTTTTTTTGGSGGNSNANNEVGSTSDLLAGLRYRPDGMVIIHKSGTMRFLRRPATAQQYVKT